MSQIFIESFIIVSICTILALMIVMMFLPTFDILTNVPLSINLITNPTLLLLLIPFIIITTVIAGSYPVFYLSSIKPINALRGVFRHSKQGVLLRKAIIFIQLVVVGVILSALFTTVKQNKFINNKNLGYKSENIIYLKVKPWIFAQYSVFENKLLSNPNIKNVTLANSFPGAMMSKQTYYYKTIDKEEKDIMVNSFVVADSAFINMFGLRLIKGRNFTNILQNDADNYVINKTLASMISNGTSAIGKELSVNTNEEYGKIVGVLDDFNFRSLHNAIEPLAIRLDYQNRNVLYVLIEINEVNKIETLDYIAETYSAIFSQRHLADISGNVSETTKLLYTKEKILQNIFTVFSVFAVIVAIVGLLAFANISLENHLKEMCIRKIHGASVGDNFYRFISEYFVIIGFASIVSFSIAYYGISKWLQNFVYQISHPFESYFYAFTIVVIIIVAITLIQVYKVSKIAPIKYLDANN